MLTKSIAKLAIAATIMIAPIAQANAYSIHVNDGVYTIECKDGTKSRGSKLMVSHAEAAHFCKLRNSSLATGSGGGDPVPAKEQKAKSKR